MPRTLGLDPGTVSLDCCALENGEFHSAWSLSTERALADPAGLVSRLLDGGTPDLIAGPSGYGLPLVRGPELSDVEVELALLPDRRAPAGLGGLGRLMRLLAGSGLPVIFTPGVIHLSSVPASRKLNRIDLGTADKVSAAVLAVADQATRERIEPSRCSFILLELGGAFTAALAVSGGRIVDGVGGTAGPMGWQSGGGWDGEVACLAGQVSKGDLFRGGVEAAIGRNIPRATVLQGYIESAEKAVRQMLVSTTQPREILVTGRHWSDQEVGPALSDRLERIAPVRQLTGFTTEVKVAAQGAAIMANGLAGGRYEAIVDAMTLRQCGGTVLDHLISIEPAAALARVRRS